MNFEAEIRDLKRRVGELEGGFGFLTNQVRDVHRDLLGFQQQTEASFVAVKGELNAVKGELKGELDVVKASVNRLDAKVDELPRAVAEVVRSELDRRA